MSIPRLNVSHSRNKSATNKRTDLSAKRNTLETVIFLRNQEAFLNWLNLPQVLGLGLRSFYDLSDGTVLCALVNKLVPNALTINDPNDGYFFQLENLQKFVTSCNKLFIVNSQTLFSPEDLLLRRNLPKVFTSLINIATTLAKSSHNLPEIQFCESVYSQKTTESYTDFLMRTIDDSEEKQRINEIAKLRKQGRVVGEELLQVPSITKDDNDDLTLQTNDLNDSLTEQNEALLKTLEEVEDRFRQELEKVNERYENSRREIQKLNESEDDERKRANLIEKQLREVNNQKDDLEKKYQSIKQELENLSQLDNQEKTDLQNQIVTLSRKNEEHEIMNEKAEQKAKFETESLRKEKELREKSESELEMLRRELERLKKEVEMLRQELESLKNEKELRMKAEIELEMLTKEYNSLRNEKDLRMKSESELAMVQKELEMLKNELDSMKNEKKLRKKSESELEMLRQEQESLKSEKELRMKAETELETLEKEFDSLRNEKDLRMKSESELAMVQQELEMLKNELDSMTNERKLRIKAENEIVSLRNEKKEIENESSSNIALLNDEISQLKLTAKDESKKNDDSITNLEKKNKLAKKQLENDKKKHESEIALLCSRNKEQNEELLKSFSERDALKQMISNLQQEIGTITNENKEREMEIQKENATLRNMNTKLKVHLKREREKTKDLDSKFSQEKNETEKVTKLCEDLSQRLDEADNTIQHSMLKLNIAEKKQALAENELTQIKSAKSRKLTRAEEEEINRKALDIFSIQIKVEGVDETDLASANLQIRKLWRMIERMKTEAQSLYLLKDNYAYQMDILSASKEELKVKYNDSVTKCHDTLCRLNTLERNLSHNQNKDYSHLLRENELLRSELENLLSSQRRVNSNKLCRSLSEAEKKRSISKKQTPRTSKPKTNSSSLPTAKEKRNANF